MQQIKQGLHDIMEQDLRRLVLLLDMTLCAYLVSMIATGFVLYRAEQQHKTTQQRLEQLERLVIQPQPSLRAVR